MWHVKSLSPLQSSHSRLPFIIPKTAGWPPQDFFYWDRWPIILSIWQLRQLNSRQIKIIWLWIIQRWHSQVGNKSVQGQVNSPFIMSQFFHLIIAWIFFLHIPRINDPSNLELCGEVHLSVSNSTCRWLCQISSASEMARWALGIAAHRGH